MEKKKMISEMGFRKRREICINRKENEKRRNNDISYRFENSILV